MWLQLSQILKKFTEGNARNLAFIFLRDVTKIEKTRVASRMGIYFGAMYRVRESKSKIRALLAVIFCYFFGPRLKHIFEPSLQLLLLIPKRFHALQVLK